MDYYPWLLLEVSTDLEHYYLSACEFIFVSMRAYNGTRWPTNGTQYGRIEIDFAPFELTDGRSDRNRVNTMIDAMAEITVTARVT